MENLFLEYVRGLEDKKRFGRECLFRVSILNNLIFFFKNFKKDMKLN